MQLHDRERGDWNLAPMAWLAEGTRKPGFRECLVLPDGYYDAFELIEQIPKGFRSSWLIWGDWRERRGKGKRYRLTPLWVTDEKAVPAMAYEIWERRQREIASLA